MKPSESYQWFCEKEEQLPRVRHHTGPSTLLPPNQGWLLHVASSNKAEGVLEHELTHCHGAQACILMPLQRPRDVMMDVWSET